MAIDRYTKCVLTVIALCLIWTSFGGPTLLPTAHAQAAGQTEVWLTGWRDMSGAVWRLPEPYPRPEGPFVNEQVRRTYEAAQARGVRLPVGTD